MIVSVEPSWSDIEIIGICDTSGLNTYVTAGDTIANCSGTVSLGYISLNNLLGICKFDQ